jgi:hypothetical protein
VSRFEVIGRPRQRGLRRHPTFGRRGERAPFSFAFTGLATDSFGTYGPIGGHAGIGFVAIDRQGNSITPDAVKWSASLNPAAAATFGTGASPTDFAIANGFFVYLHMTYDAGEGPFTVTRSFAARPAPYVPAQIVIDLVEQDASGDVLVFYTTDKDDAAVEVVVYNAVLPDPVAADFGGANPLYLDQGTVALTVSGAGIELELPDDLDGFYKMAMLPASGLDGNVAVSEAFQITAVATITIEGVGLQDGEGDLPISYTISRDDAGVQAVLFAATAPNPLAADFGGGGAPTYVDQGTLSLTKLGGPLAFDVVGSFTGSYRLALLPTNGDDDDVVVSDAFILTTLTGVTMLAQLVTSTSFVTTHNITVDAVAGQTVVLVVTNASTTLPTSIVIDPGGPNQTTMTIRAQGNVSSNIGVLADAVWPATGALNVRVTYGAGVASVGLTAMSVGSRTHQDSVYVGSASETPERHVVTRNTVAGQAVIMSVVINSAAAIQLTSGVDEQVGSTLTVGARRAYVLKNDAVAGGAPETFRVDWPAAAFIPSGGILGVYA